MVCWSAYKIAMNQVRPFIFGGNWIWKAKILPRIQSFVWLCLHNSIGVRECLAWRGIVTESGCPLCHSGNESILHALRDCDVVKPVWSQLGVNSLNNRFFTSNVFVWLEENGTNHQVSGHYYIPWSTTFLFAIWIIWKHRNQVLFKNQGPNPQLAKLITRSVLEYSFCVARTREASSRVPRPIRWTKPDSGWFKLNTDGSSLNNLGIARGGGLIRDDNGSWIVGFARKVGVTTCFLAELWALQDGLSLCVSRKCQVVEVEIDAKAIVDALSNPNYSSIFVSSIMDDCRNLLSQIPQMCFRHCYCEMNRCADALARKGGCQATDFVIFKSPPVNISSLLDFDLSGLHLSRLCPASLLSF